MLDILYEQDGVITGPVFDAVENVRWSDPATATNLAVGADAPFSDHVQQEPDTLTASISVSNFPLLAPPGVQASRSTIELGPFADQTIVEGSKVNAAGSVSAARFEPRNRTVQATVTRFAGGEALTRAQDVLAELKRLKAGAVALTITTAHRVGENMVLVEIDHEDTARNGGRLDADLSFRQIQVARSEIVPSVVPLDSRAEERRRRDRQAAEEEEGEDRNSVLSILTGWGTALEGGS